MIEIKTPEELAIMEKGGKILAETLYEVIKHTKPGISELEIDALAEKYIRKQGAEPGFKRVRGYHHTICASTNNVIVHGIPTTYKLKEGDIFGIDCGVYFDGFHTDMAETIIIGGEKAVDPKIVSFLDTGRKALEVAISMVKPGNHIGHISKAIQMIVEEGAGYGVTRELIGHGVGRELHEEPEVPGYLSRKVEKTPELKERMVIAIEVIYNMGKPDIAYLDDGWTIVSADHSLSGLFERTVAVTKSGYKIITE
jgi:methionyl aminopeptidase